MSTAGAIQPFEFVGCLELREMLGRAAWDERELLAGIEDVPAGSISYHTRSYFLRSRYLAAPYPNATVQAWGINNDGTVVGVAGAQPFRWRDGDGFTLLPTVSGSGGGNSYTFPRQACGVTPLSSSISKG